MRVGKVTTERLMAKARPWSVGGMPHVSLSSAETASVLREALKAHWPGVRFWVRAKDFSGGGSVSVYYDGGAGVGHIYAPRAVPPEGAPSLTEVQDFVNVLGGKDFDGMIDMQFDHDALLLPDGTILYGGTSGTEGSRGSIPRVTVEPPDGAVLLDSYVYLSVSNGVPGDAPAAVLAAAEANRDLRSYGAVERW